MPAVNIWMLIRVSKYPMLEFFLSYLLVYKYAVLFVVVAAASFGFPLPATPLIMAAGAFTAQGYFNIHWMLACSFFASVLGDSLGYYVSYRFGRKALIRIGFRPILDSPRFARIEKSFRRRSRLSIFLSRFLFTAL